MIQKLVEKGLAARGVPIYSLNFKSLNEKELAVNIILYLPKDMDTAKDFIIEQFDVKKGQQEHIKGRPLKIPAKLKRKRQGLPEWQDLKGKTMVFVVDTVLHHGLSSLIASTETSPSDKEPISILEEQISRIEDFFNDKPYVQQEAKVDASLKETPHVEEGHTSSSLLSKEDIESALSIIPSGITQRWVELAEENLLAITNSYEVKEDWINKLEPFLKNAGITSEEDLASFAEAHLNSWEDLYEAFETARLQGIIPKDNLSLIDLFCLLLQGCFMSSGRQF
jgi:hypothetical protein